MKKILILGAAGIAGHMITRYLKKFKSQYKIHTTARNNKYVKADYYIDIIKDLKKLKTIIKTQNYDIIINCIE